MDRKKLLVCDRVEVRQFEEGLQGSWHPGVVVGISSLGRHVRYNELLSDNGKTKLVEYITVSEAIEGLHRRRHVAPTYRGHIRPLPPPFDTDSCGLKLHFGDCVDAFFEDAWWEGVILDSNDEAAERSVYFPDEDDECMFSLNNLRRTRVWDEYTGVWTDRGVWILIDLIRELGGNIPSSKYIKVLWSCLRSNYAFKKMLSEWTCGARSLWREYFADVIHTIGSKLSKTDLACHKILVCKLSQNKHKSKSHQQLKVDLHDPLIPARKRKSVAKEEIPVAESKLKFRRPGLRVVPTVEGDINLGENLLEGTDETKAKHLCGASNSAVKLDQVFPTIHKRWLRNPKAKRDKRKLVKKSVGNMDKLQVDPSREEDFDSHASTCAVSGGGVSRAISKKLVNKARRKFEFTYPESGLKQLHVGAFPIIKKRKRSTMKKKKRLSIDRDSAFIQPLLNADRKDTKQAKGSLFAKWRRVTSSVENSGQSLSLKDMVSRPRKRRRRRGHNNVIPNDTICFVCRYGEELDVSCSHCFSSYHLGCVGLEVAPTEKWFCPSCCCGLCGVRDTSMESKQLTNVCFQCSRQYHTDCLNKAGCLLCTDYPTESFCSNSCYKLYQDLHQLLGALNPTCADGVTWSLIRSKRNDCKSCAIPWIGNRVKLSEALKIIEHSFEPIVDLHTKRNLIRDVVFNYVSKLKRLDFRGFYVIILQKGDEVVSAATVRIHGKKVAEMPLIATNFEHRRQGMCRLLVQELEKLLVEMGVEKLILPAASQSNTSWEMSFGFSEMPSSDRLHLVGYPFLGFQGTKILQKDLLECRQKAITDPAVVSQTTMTDQAISSLIPAEGPIDERRFTGLFYTRKLRSLAFRKQNKINRCADVINSFHQVYKRRRILAS